MKPEHPEETPHGHGESREAPHGKLSPPSVCFARCSSQWVPVSSGRSSSTRTIKNMEPSALISQSSALCIHLVLVLRSCGCPPEVGAKADKKEKA